MVGEAIQVLGETHAAQGVADSKSLLQPTTWPMLPHAGDVFFLLYGLSASSPSS